MAIRLNPTVVAVTPVLGALFEPLTVGAQEALSLQVENLSATMIDHILGVLAVFLAVFFGRRGLKATRRTQKLSDIIPKAVDAALRHQKQGANQSIDLRVTASQFAKHLDLEDGKRDFTDEKIHAEVVAELHRRGL